MYYYAEYLKNITEDTIIRSYVDNLGDKLAAKKVVCYSYDHPRYGNNNPEDYKLYVEKMKLLIRTLIGIA